MLLVALLSEWRHPSCLCHAAHHCSKLQTAAVTQQTSDQSSWALQVNPVPAVASSSLPTSHWHASSDYHALSVAPLPSSCPAQPWPCPWCGWPTPPSPPAAPPPPSGRPAATPPPAAATCGTWPSMASCCCGTLPSLWPPPTRLSQVRAGLRGVPSDPGTHIHPCCVAAPSACCHPSHCDLYHL
jgi:hypothetical protein